MSRIYNDVYYVTTLILLLINLVMEMGKFVQGGGMSKYRDSSQGLTSSKECKGDLCNGER